MKQPIDKRDLASDVITWLRFPMIVGIILLHTPIINRNVGGVVPYPSEKYPVLNMICEHILKADICEAFVPLFFFISGFLFFYKAVPFTKETYLRKIKGRFHSLVIPYLFWNTAFMVFVAVISWTVPSLLTEKKSFLDLSLPEIAGAYWDLNQGLIPLWFIRDLIIINLFTPIIYVCLHGRQGFFVVLGMALLFLPGHFHYIPGIGMRCAFPYIFGAWFSINTHSFLIHDSVQRHALYIISIILLIVETVLWKNNGTSFAQNRLVLIAVFISVLQLVASGLSRCVLKNNRNWADSSFFAFVFHMFIIYIPVYIALKAFPASTLSGLILQVLIPVVVGIACHLIFVMIHKLCPAFADFIVGKRTSAIYTIQ